MRLEILYLCPYNSAQRIWKNLIEPKDKDRSLIDDSMSAEDSEHTRKWDCGKLAQFL
jgi:hypothetical protein